MKKHPGTAGTADVPTAPTEPVEADAGQAAS
jgi:hypothetical protein